MGAAPVPADNREALTLLLQVCPEFTSILEYKVPEGSEGEFAALDNDDILWTSIVGDLVHNFFENALKVASAEEMAAVRDAPRPESSKRKARHTRVNESISDLLIHGKAEVADLVLRLFSVFEACAQSPDWGIRHSIYMELVESQFSDVQKLAGPQLWRLLSVPGALQ